MTSKRGGPSEKQKFQVGGWGGEHTQKGLDRVSGQNPIQTPPWGKHAMEVDAVL